MTESATVYVRTQQQPSQNAIENLDEKTQTKSTQSSTKPPSQSEPDHIELANKVREVVLKAGEDIRKEYPILQQQDLLGATILIFAVSSMIFTASLYANGTIPALLCIVLNAFFASITHELEHDNIHNMYFKNNPFLHNLMFVFVWAARPNALNPWIRRKFHIHHHKFSGTESDIEEQMIGNGWEWGFRRMLITSDQLMSVISRPISFHYIIQRWLDKMPKEEGGRLWLTAQGFLGFIPGLVIYISVLYTFAAFHLSSFFFQTSAIWSQGVIDMMPMINFLAVVWILPNYLRSLCLQFVSSNMHYYGDIDAQDVIKQTQVLNPWWLIPMQLFCANFGATHAIHHFVINEPFYIRQLTANTAYKIMKEVGVRFNDFDAFRRTNRWGEYKKSD